MILLKNSMTRIFILSVFFTFSINVTAQSDSIETPNQDQYEAGKKIFEGVCKACHTIGEGKRIGPDLQGILDRRTEDGIIKFVQDPKSQGGEIMQPQPYSADEIRSV
ncbi:MAG TPA: cytochrome c, partial [Flavobacteriales bacterium]|nr:cytochrome c [Flavobacteriales bacterium]